jgi:hypothetical protein
MRLKLGIDVLLISDAIEIRTDPNFPGVEYGNVTLLDSLPYTISRLTTCKPEVTPISPLICNDPI